jgi:parallel beta-helix repeat protein
VGTRGGSGGAAIVNDNSVSDHADGIHVLGAGNTVRNNLATKNSRSGIAVDCPSLVSENTALGNGKANIALTGTGCRASNNLAPGTVR